MENQSEQPGKVRLFIKPYCGWCHEAMDWLNRYGISYEKLDVIGDSQAWNEMLELSGQTMTPTIEVNGKVLADFDTDQLSRFWQQLKNE